MRSNSIYLEIVRSVGQQHVMSSSMLKFKRMSQRRYSKIIRRHARAESGLHNWATLHARRLLTEPRWYEEAYVYIDGVLLGKVAQLNFSPSEDIEYEDSQAEKE